MLKLVVEVVEQWDGVEPIRRDLLNISFIYLLSNAAGV